VLKYDLARFDNDASVCYDRIIVGSGKGSGASLSVWSTLVVILLQTMDPFIPEQMHFNPLSGARPHSRLCDAFVNDTPTGFTSSSDDGFTYDDLISKLQHIAQTWEHVLHLSGGKNTSVTVHGSS
jgi:hypothetical protein